MIRSISLKAILITWVVLLQTGCVSSTIVNLTPSKLTRNAEGIYRFEAAWDSNQKSIKEETLQGYLVMDEVQYPMERVALVEDRWEVMIPLDEVPEGQTYHMKFDYLYDSYPEPKPNSLRSKPFSLELMEPNAE